MLPKKIVGYAMAAGMKTDPAIKPQSEEHRALQFSEADIARTLDGLVASVNAQIVVHCSCDQVLR